MKGKNQKEIQLEDEQRYGPPSPRPFHRFTPSLRLNSNEPSSTDELFLSESYPPSVQAIQLPFFNLKLDSPIGMGRGQPIITHQLPSTVYGSVDRIWKRITKLLSEKPYQLVELVDTLSYPVNHSALNSLQLALSNYHLQLPRVVRDHFLTHDGQDVFTSHSTRSSTSASSLGIVWGLWLMSCEEVEAEWGFWRRFDGGLIPSDVFTATDFASQQQLKQQPHSSSSNPITSSSSSSIHQHRLNQSMSSCPAGWVHEVYSHPGWLPLLSDRAGNYIGVDLSPPPLQISSSSSSPFQSPHDHPSKQGLSSSPSSSSSTLSMANPPYHLGGGQGNARPESGQVIAFGREIDQKVVLWRGEGNQGWANWLASFADDLEDGKFASLIGRRKVKKSLNESSTSKRRRNSDGERGCWSTSDDDSDDTEDGLGDLGYFNHDTAFVGQDEDGDFHGWKLAPEYRGMSVIEALCARSQQRWAEVGSYSSRHVFSKFQESNSTRQSPGLRSVNQAEGDSYPHSNPCSPEANGSFVSEDINTNPVTPIAFVTPPSPRPAEPDLENLTTPPPKSRAVASPNQSSSTTGLHPIPAHRSQKRPQIKTDVRPPRPRAPPPAPMSLDLPTMDSLMLEVDGHSSPTHSDHSHNRTSVNLSSTTTSIVPASSSINNDNYNGTENQSTASKLASRFSMVGQRISEEMVRRTSHPINPPTHHHSSSSSTSSSPSRKHQSSNSDSNQKEMIGMVMIINEDKNANQDLNPLSHSSSPISSTHSNEFNNQRNLHVKLDSNRPSPGSDNIRNKPLDGLGIMKNII